MSDPKIPAPPENLKKAAEAGDAEAQSDLGRWYAKNLPKTADAEMWFRRAAEKGLPKAFHNLGVLAAKSNDNELAIQWFSKAVAADWRNSIFPLGHLLEESGDTVGAVDTYNLGIQKGCPDSMVAMADRVIAKQIEHLYENARIWCERAVAQGHVGAHATLATIFHEGLGVKRSPPDAVQLWLKAARQGHPGAQLMIGMSCEMGLVLRQDRVAAMRFFSASAAQGNEGAEACLWSLEQRLTPEEKAEFEREPTLFAHAGPGHPGKVPPSDLLWAASAGDAESQNELGIWYSDNLPQTPHARMWLERAADLGSGNAYHNLGVAALDTGDLPLAAEWFKKAVDADVLESFQSLGAILERTGDLDGAAEIFRLGAYKKCPHCESGLGRLAFHEQTPDSYKRAHYWDKKAAAQGHASSQTRLGMMYHEGLGVEPDPEAAVYWWQQGARQGNKVAQYMMGVAHHKGEGASKDRLAAMRFLRASAAQGGTYAEDYLPKVEAELTPEEKSQLALDTTAGGH
ncbi:MAG: tetratricopeptide repeat protein [Parvibaculaceae bacterium]